MTNPASHGQISHAATYPSSSVPLKGLLRTSPFMHWGDKKNSLACIQEASIFLQAVG